MPGLAGILTFGPGHSPPPATLPPRDASGRDLHLLIDQPRFRLGGYFAPNRAPSVAGGPGGATVALYGHCIDPVAGRALDAASLARSLADEGDRVWDRLEGAFHVVSFDPTARRLRIANDRLGVLPLFLLRDRGRFSFAPRIALLPGALQRAPDSAGVVTFLAAGYCLGTRTLREGVSLLAPASILDVGIEDGCESRRQYWDFAFWPADHDVGRLRRRLNDAIDGAVGLLAPDAPSSAGVFLSGGWDCRGLLGSLLAAGTPPRAVITNGASDDLPGTDTALARTLSRDLVIDYRFCRRDPAVAARRSADGIARCELLTDSSPEVFGQHEADPALFAGLRYVLKGDEVWGWKDEALDRQQAIGQVMPTHVGDSVRRVLDGDVGSRADAIYDGEIDELLSGAQSRDWNERKDYLYLKGRETRYIFGLGASDEEHTEVRRPFLARGVLDVVAATPSRLRVQKNLYLETLRRSHPALFRYGRNHRSSTADYYSHMADCVRETTLGRLAAGQTLGGLLDPSAVAGLVSRFEARFAGESRPSLRQAALARLHDRWGARIYRSARYRRRGTRSFRPWCVSDRVLAFRLYLLLEYFHAS